MQILNICQATAKRMSLLMYLYMCKLERNAKNNAGICLTENISPVWKELRSVVVQRRHSFSRHNINTYQEIWWCAVCLQSSSWFGVGIRQEMKYYRGRRPHSVCVITVCRSVPTLKFKTQKNGSLSTRSKRKGLVGHRLNGCLTRGY